MTNRPIGAAIAGGYDGNEDGRDSVGDNDMTWSKISTVLMALLSIGFFAVHMNALAIIFGGVFLLGLGEPVNQPRAGVLRKIYCIGILLEVAGVAVMICASIYFWLL
jgi:hypothetical protein